MSMLGRRMLLRLTFWGKILQMGKDRLVRRVYEVGPSKAGGRPEWEHMVRLDAKVAEAARAGGGVENKRLRAESSKYQFLLVSNTFNRSLITNVSMITLSEHI
jgi:hypothetical protein